MEAQFEKIQCSCLDKVVMELQNIEAAQEMKLTEGMPDIGRIVSAWGQVVLRGKEWRSDEIALSAGMMVWVLYAPEDGTSVRCLEGWIPFQMKWDLPDQTPEGIIRIRSLTRFVDARSISARKIMVRSGAAVMAEAWVPKNYDIFTPGKGDQSIQMLRSRYPLRLPREAGEKTFQMEEDLTIPASVPQPEKLVYYTLSPQITDQRVMANKVVFRGCGNLHVLYLSEEGQLHSWDFELPFSQFTELNSSHSADAQADVIPAVTGLELELDPEGTLHAKSSFAAQYLVDDQQMLELVEDAYAPGRELELQQQMLEVPAVLENRRENIYAEQTIPAEANFAAHVRFLPDFPRQRRTDTGISMTMPGIFQVLYYGEDGVLRSATARWEGQQEFPSDENSRVEAVPMTVPEPQVALGGGNMTLRGELPLQMFTTTDQGIPMVTGVTMGDERLPDNNRPSLILRRAGDARLWDIAKMSGSTMDAIRSANGLQEEPAPNQMLLIPVM